MTTGEFFSSPSALIIFGVAFIGSLFACRRWIARILFTLIIPIVYALVCFLCIVILGSLPLLLPAGMASIIEEVGVAMAICATAVLFLIQVLVMAKDGESDTHAYTLKFRGRKNRVTEAPDLPHVVTQRRYMRGG